MPVAVLARCIELDVVVVRVLDVETVRPWPRIAGINRSINVVLPLPW
jgi:hypothetical protein